MRRILIFIFALNITLFAQRTTIPNPGAPKELSQFQFLVGEFECKGKSLLQDGTYASWEAVWKGYYILDGFVFADDFIMVDENGKYTFLGSTYRIFNTKENKWDMRFVDALNTNWINIEGKFIDGEMMQNSERIDSGGNKTLIKVVFSNISDEGFTWKNHRSKDNGKTWLKDAIVIDAKKIK